MSMMGNAGSSAAAQDVINYIDRLILEENLPEDWSAYEVALKIRNHAKEIKEAADSGWY